MILKLLCFVSVICIYGVSCAPTPNGTAVKITCAAPFNLSKNFTELSYFIQHGEFPAGKENLKCYWKCFVEGMDMFDTHFNPDKEKMKAIAKSYPTDQAVQVLVSEKFLQSCLKLEDTPSRCDKAYNFMKCYANVKSGRSANAGFPYVLFSVSAFCVLLCIVSMYLFFKRIQCKHVIK